MTARLEEVTQALQAIDPEEQQVVGDLGEACGKLRPREVLASGCEHEQDLQVALHYAAVLQRRSSATSERMSRLGHTAGTSGR